MGLLKAGAGALGGVLADSWRDYFYCESLDADILVTKGEKRAGNRSSNKKGTENIISCLLYTSCGIKPVPQLRFPTKPNFAFYQQSPFCISSKPKSCFRHGLRQSL